MLANSHSNPRVRRALNEYSGSALARLPYIAFAEPGSHVLTSNFITAEDSS